MLDVTIPSGALTPSTNIDLGVDEVWVGVISPSNWVTSDINAQITQDNGASWAWIEAGANSKQGYFPVQQASRGYIKDSVLSNIAPRNFKIASVNDQLTSKTLTLLIMDV